MVRFYQGASFGCRYFMHLGHAPFLGRHGLDYVGLRYMNVNGPRQHQDAAYAGVISHHA